MSEKLTITYNGEIIATLFEGQRAAIPCKAKLMTSNLVFAVISETAEEQLTAPTMHLSKNNVEITSQDINTESFEIFLNGVSIGDVKIQYITFTVDGTQYKAIEGMDWAGFSNSVYGLGRFSIDEKTGMILYDGFKVEGVFKNKKILADGVYTVDKSEN